MFAPLAVIGVYLLTTSTVAVLAGVLRDTQAAPYVGLFSPFALLNGVAVELFGAQPIQIAHQQSIGWLYLLVTAGVFAACCAVLRWRYRKIEA